MCGIKEVIYKPIAENHKTYQRLYELYKILHDSFGTQEGHDSLYQVMKELLVIKEQVNR